MITLNKIIRSCLIYSFCVVVVSSSFVIAAEENDSLSSSLTSEVATVLSSCQALLDDGRSRFEANCKICHGSGDWNDPIRTIDLTADAHRHVSMGNNDPSLPLPEYIARYMPLPGLCTGECADNITVFLRSLSGQNWCPSVP